MCSKPTYLPEPGNPRPPDPLILRRKPDAEEVEEDAPHRERRDSDDHAEDAPQPTSNYHGEEDQDRVHAQGVALDLGRQEVALELLDPEEQEELQERLEALEDVLKMRRPG